MTLSSEWTAEDVQSHDFFKIILSSVEDSSYWNQQKDPQMRLDDLSHWLGFLGLIASQAYPERAHVIWRCLGERANEIALANPLFNELEEEDQQKALLEMTERKMPGTKTRRQLAIIMKSYVDGSSPDAEQREKWFTSFWEGLYHNDRLVKEVRLKAMQWGDHCQQLLKQPVSSATVDQTSWQQDMLKAAQKWNAGDNDIVDIRHRMPGSSAHLASNQKVTLSQEMSGFLSNAFSSITEKVNQISALIREDLFDPDSHLEESSAFTKTELAQPFHRLHSGQGQQGQDKETKETPGLLKMDSPARQEENQKENRESMPPDHWDRQINILINAIELKHEAAKKGALALSGPHALTQERTHQKQMVSVALSLASLFHGLWLESFKEQALKGTAIKEVLQVHSSSGEDNFPLMEVIDVHQDMLKRAEHQVEYQGCPSSIAPSSRLSSKKEKPEPSEKLSASELQELELMNHYQRLSDALLSWVFKTNPFVLNALYIQPLSDRERQLFDLKPGTVLKASSKDKFPFGLSDKPLMHQPYDASEAQRANDLLFIKIMGSGALQEDHPFAADKISEMIIGEKLKELELVGRDGESASWNVFDTQGHFVPSLALFAGGCVLKLMQEPSKSIQDQLINVCVTLSKASGFSKPLGASKSSKASNSSSVSVVTQNVVTQNSKETPEDISANASASDASNTPDAFVHALTFAKQGIKELQKNWLEMHHHFLEWHQFSEQWSAAGLQSWLEVKKLNDSNSVQSELQKTQTHPLAHIRTTLTHLITEGVISSGDLSETLDQQLMGSIGRATAQLELLELQGVLAKVPSSHHSSRELQNPGTQKNQRDLKDQSSPDGQGNPESQSARQKSPRKRSL